MYKKVKVGDKSLDMVANAATAIRYKQVFKRDLLKGMSAGEDIEVAEIIPELGYIMAMQGEKADMNKLNEDTFITWLESFEALDFMEEDVALDIMGLWQGNREVSAESKKKDEQLSEA